MSITKYDQLKGCFLAGALGDAMGSSFENQNDNESSTYYAFEKPKEPVITWEITDDTQLTFATIESIIEDIHLSPNVLSNSFVHLFSKRSIRGVGSSTLKALQELEAGGHWSQVGRRGEYAAGNGAAMRIAPLAFLANVDRKRIQDICFITHHNDEAYSGALAVVLAIKEITDNRWDGKTNLLSTVAAQLPDTRVKDRIVEISKMTDLKEIGDIGSSGYVVDSIPLALAAANQVRDVGLDQMFQSLIAIGGDTDTNCSIAGQIAGCYIGKSNFSSSQVKKLEQIPEYEYLLDATKRFGEKLNWI